LPDFAPLRGKAKNVMAITEILRALVHFNNHNKPRRHARRISERPLLSPSSGLCLLLSSLAKIILRFVIANTSRAFEGHYNKIRCSHSAGTDGETTMTFDPYRTTASSGFTRVAAYIAHRLLDDSDRQSIDELSQRQRPDHSSRDLNQPHELADFMCRTIAP